MTQFLIDQEIHEQCTAEIARLRRELEACAEVRQQCAEDLRAELAPYQPKAYLPQLRARLASLADDWETRDAHQ